VNLNLSFKYLNKLNIGRNIFFLRDSIYVDRARLSFAIGIYIVHPKNVLKTKNK